MSKFEIGQRVFFCGYDQPALYRKHAECGGATVIGVRSRIQAAMADASGSALYEVCCLCGHTTWTTTSSLDSIGGYRDRRGKKRTKMGHREETETRSLPSQGSNCERCGGWISITMDEDGTNYAHCVMCGATKY